MSLCVPVCAPVSCVQQDLSLIKTDGVDNACVPVLPSGFEKENILMFARRGDTIGGDIVTGDWSDNGKWDSAVDIRCKVAPNVQRGNVHAAAIYHNVPSGVVDGDSGGGNLPPPICKPVSNLRCSISQCQSHLVSIIGLLCFGKAKPPIFQLPSVDQWPMPLSDEGYFPLQSISWDNSWLWRRSLSLNWRLFSHRLWHCCVNNRSHSHIVTLSLNRDAIISAI